MKSDFLVEGAPENIYTKPAESEISEDSLMIDKDIIKVEEIDKQTKILLKQNLRQIKQLFLSKKDKAVHKIHAKIINYLMERGLMEQRLKLKTIKKAMEFRLKLYPTQFRLKAVKETYRQRYEIKRQKTMKR